MTHRPQPEENGGGQRDDGEDGWTAVVAARDGAPARRGGTLDAYGDMIRAFMRESGLVTTGNR